MYVIYTDGDSPTREMGLCSDFVSTYTPINFDNRPADKNNGAC